MMSTTAGTVELAPGDALLVVDVQNDFLPGGALAVLQGDQIIPPLNRYIAAFQAKHLPIFASRDWHPPNHCSFHEQGGRWPPHCIAGSRGAALADDLLLPASASLVSKATQQDRDCYSALEAVDLVQQLRQAAVSRIFVGGLATEVCVLATVEDALRAGFQVVLLSDAIGSLDSPPGAGRQAIERMRCQGARPIVWEDLSR